MKALIDNGARLVARLADGRTALHLAAALGNVEMVKMILQKSEENEEEESKKEEARKWARIAARQKMTDPANWDGHSLEGEPDDHDLELVEMEDSDEDMQSTTTGSYVKVNDEQNKPDDNLVLDDEAEGPDVFDINVLAWDTQCSPLHYAILNGQTDVVKELVQTFGADVLLPIKLFQSHNKKPRGAILTLILALRLPLEKAKAMTQALLDLGASSAQADTRQFTALHYISADQPEVLDTLFQYDEPAAKRAINHLASDGGYYNPMAQSPLMSAIYKGNALAALKLLGAGAETTIQFKDWMKTVEAQDENISRRDSAKNNEHFLRDIEQPIVLAVQNELPDIVEALLERGADPNTITKGTQSGIQSENNRRYYVKEFGSVLDLVRTKIKQLSRYRDQKPPVEEDYQIKDGVDYLDGIEEGSYKEFITKIKLDEARTSDEQSKEDYEKKLKQYNERKGVAEKKDAIEELLQQFRRVENALLRKGAKTLAELHPDMVEDKKARADTPAKEQKPTAFSVEFDFCLHDLTDLSRDAYVKL